MNAKDAVILFIVNYRDYPSIIAIKELDVFIRKPVCHTLKFFKPTQDSDISIIHIKDNSDLFVDFNFTNLNESTAHLIFPSLLKLENIALSS